jgi:hypothetical protein
MAGASAVNGWRDMGPGASRWLSGARNWKSPHRCRDRQASASHSAAVISRKAADRDYACRMAPKGGFRTFPPRSGTRSFDPEESFAPTPGSNCLDRGAHSHLLPKDMVTGSRQLVEQGPRLFQIGRIEAFGEPAVDRGEKVAGFRAATLAAAEPSEAHGRA